MRLHDWLKGVSNSSVGGEALYAMGNRLAVGLVRMWGHKGPLCTGAEGEVVYQTKLLYVLKHIHH